MFAVVIGLGIIVFILIAIITIIAVFTFAAIVVFSIWLIMRALLTITNSTLSKIKAKMKLQSKPATTVSTPRSRRLTFLNLPSEIGALILEEVIKSAVDDANTEGPLYRMCVPTSFRVDCNGMMEFMRELLWCLFKLRKLEPSLPELRVEYIEACQEVSKQIDLTETLLLRGEAPSTSISNPLTPYLLINWQLNREVQAVVARSFPNGRFLEAHCCCEHAVRKTHAVSKVVTMARVGSGDYETVHETAAKAFGLCRQHL